MKLIVESGQSELNRAGRYASDGRLRGQVCHTQRRINADELARIT